MPFVLAAFAFVTKTIDGREQKPWGPTRLGCPLLGIFLLYSSYWLHIAPLFLREGLAPMLEEVSRLKRCHHNMSVLVLTEKLISAVTLDIYPSVRKFCPTQMKNEIRCSSQCLWVMTLYRNVPCFWVIILSYSFLLHHSTDGSPSPSMDLLPAL
jgi:hypothetical protein